MRQYYESLHKDIGPSPASLRAKFQMDRNADIKRRLKAGDTIENVARRYGLSTIKIEKIRSLGE